MAKADASDPGGVLVTCPTQPAWLTRRKQTRAIETGRPTECVSGTRTIFLDLSIEFFLENSAGELTPKNARDHSIEAPPDSGLFTSVRLSSLGHSRRKEGWMLLIPTRVFRLSSATMAYRARDPSERTDRGRFSIT